MGSTSHHNDTTGTCFPHYWPFVWGIHQSHVDPPPKGTVVWSLDVFFDTSLQTNCRTKRLLLIIWDSMIIMSHHYNKETCETLNTSHCSVIVASHTRLPYMANYFTSFESLLDSIDNKKVKHSFEISSRSTPPDWKCGIACMYGFTLKSEHMGQKFTEDISKCIFS